MSWPFEHWDNGKVYLHNDNWDKFRKDVEKYGYNNYQHDWDHYRIFAQIHTPRKNIQDIPIEDSTRNPNHSEELKYKIYNIFTGYSLIYDLFPAFVRTKEDPEGWLPSWHLWAESDHKNIKKQNELEILSTRYITEQGDYVLFAKFRDMFWKVGNESYKTYGIGPNKPLKSAKNKSFRSIFDPFETQVENE